VNKPVQVELTPFVPTPRGRGIVLEVRDLGDGTFEVVTMVPGHGAKQGGTVTAEELFRLGRELTKTASALIGARWRDVGTH
jgi:hypothetical protein